MFTEYGESLQLQFFREFYAELLAVKRAASATASPAQASLAVIPQPQSLKHKLEAILQRHERAAAKIGGYFVEPYSDSRYAMVGLADEILINTDWKYSDWWKSELLEMSVFGSYEAGEEFYRRADRLLAERRTSENAEAAKIYLLCLLLGFRGKYRYDGGESISTQYTARLYEYVFDKPYIEQADIASLSPEEDLHLRSFSETKYFAPLHRRYLWLLGILAFFVLATTILWFVITAPLRNTLQAIEEAKKTTVVNTPPPEIKVVATSPSLNLRTVNEIGTHLVTQVTILDSLGFTTYATGKTTEQKEMTFANLPKNTTLRVVMEAPAHYPEVKMIRTKENDTISLRAEIRSLESLVGKPISLEYISFASSKAELMESSNSYLERVARALKSRPDIRISISGHTDNSGLAQSNQKLSRERAESVLNYFVRYGIAMERLKAIGEGSAKPRADNATEEGRAKNRRVEILLGK